MNTVVITGATGVVGSALLNALQDFHVVAIAHRRPGDAGAATWISGDITRHRFGMSKRSFRELARRADAIVHCAAITDFAGKPAQFEAVNVRGTEVVLELAAQAEATLYHISTAFLDREPLNVRAGSGAATYLVSKRLAEAQVHASGLPAVVIRPSVIIGDSRNGQIARFQGVHALAGSLLQNSVPIIPMNPATRIDFVPQDVVAACIADLIRRDERSGTRWLTAGDSALTVNTMIDSCSDLSREHGREFVRPRLVGRDVVERLIEPLFADVMPASARRRFQYLMQLGSLFDVERLFPTSLVDLGQDVSSAQLEQSWRRSMQYWLEREPSRDGVSLIA